MEFARKTLSKPRRCFQDSDKLLAVTYRDAEHTPYNKRHGQVKSVLNFDIQRHKEAGWVNLCLTEMTTAESGRMQSRTISTTIPKEFVEAFGRFILKGE